MERHSNPEDFDLYALGALDGEERTTFESHLRTCAYCQQQLAEARAVCALIGMSAEPVAPAPSVKASLMQRVKAEPRTTAAAVPVKPVVRKRHWGLRFSLGFAVIAILLGLTTTWLWKLNEHHLRQLDALQTKLDATQQEAKQNAAALHAVTAVVGAPDTIQVTLQQQTGGPPGQAHVLYNARLGVVVYSGELAPAPSNKSYQLWLVPASGVPVNAGIVEPNQETQAAVVHLPEGLAAKAFAVTVEPQGGSPQPTGAKVLVGLASS
jgi:anti-sigma-K factor RskA